MDSDDSEVPTPTERIPQSAEKYWAPGEEGLQALIYRPTRSRNDRGWDDLNAHLNARGEDETLGYPVNTYTSDGPQRPQYNLKWYQQRLLRVDKELRDQRLTVEIISRANSGHWTI